MSEQQRNNLSPEELEEQELREIDLDDLAQAIKLLQQQKQQQQQCDTKIKKNLLYWLQTNTQQGGACLIPTTFINDTVLRYLWSQNKTTVQLNIIIPINWKGVDINIYVNEGIFHLEYKKESIWQAKLAYPIRPFDKKTNEYFSGTPLELNSFISPELITFSLEYEWEIICIPDINDYRCINVCFN